MRKTCTPLQAAAADRNYAQTPANALMDSKDAGETGRWNERGKGANGKRERDTGETRKESVDGGGWVAGRRSNE